MNANRKSLTLVRPAFLTACGRPGLGCWMVLFLAASAELLAAQSATNTLPQLAGPYGEMKPTFWEQYGTAILVVIFVCSTLVGALFWLLRLPKLPVVTPPEVVARAALAKLLTQSETGKQLSEISQILRRYIVAAFGLPTNELTTTEFCAQITGNENIGPESAKAVSSFLKDCDLRKFSPTNATAPLNAANQALAIIAEMEKRRAKPAAGANP